MIKTCLKCGRPWVPLPTDPPDSPICHACRHGIPVNVKPKEKKR